MAFDRVTFISFRRPRLYDVPLGIWMTQDPMGYAGSGPNLYQFVGGNPIRYTDASGLTPTSTLYAPWYKYVSDNGMGGDFSGLWHDLTTINKLGLSFNNNGDLNYYPFWKTISLPTSGFPGSIMDFGHHPVRDAINGSNLAHELWHAYFDQKIRGYPNKYAKLIKFFKDAASKVGGGVTLPPGQTITDQQRLTVLDESIGCTITVWTTGTIMHTPFSMQPGYLSGEGLSEQDKQDNVPLSPDVWKVVRWLISHNLDSYGDVDPTDILSGKLK